jgi:sulfate transport system ATP-binding protein
VSIQVKDVSKRFGGFVALDRINLRVPDGSLLALLGPSGSGKTTLLRIIAGLEVADEGSVLYQDEDITNHSARDRKVGFVFQHYALFRHMTIEDNIGFGLRVRGAKKPEIRERVRELLGLIRLEGFGRRYPGQLSGGQRQRVALARALAARPKVLLLDEPFGALDARVRQELRHWLRRLHEEIHVTSIFVTHDQEEAFEVADHVVVMNGGRIEQVGTPEEVFETPATPFVMGFLGSVNVFHGRVESGRALLGSLTVDYPQHLESAPVPAAGYARPHELELERGAGSGGGYWAMLTDINAAAAVVRLELEGPDGTLQVALSRERYEALLPRRGESLYVRPRRVRVFLKDGNGKPAEAAEAGLDSAKANGQTPPPRREPAVPGGRAAS